VQGQHVSWVASRACPMMCPPPGATACASAFTPPSCPCRCTKCQDASIGIFDDGDYNYDAAYGLTKRGTCKRCMEEYCVACSGDATWRCTK
jgi:hypothetical protein